jgi:integrase
MATITPRPLADGSISYRAMIRIKKKGKVVYQVSKTFSKENLARRWAKKKEVELENDDALYRAIHSKSGGVTVGDLIKKYVSTAGDLQEWGRSKSQSLAALQTFDIADKDALSLTAKDIVDHCIWRIEKRGVKPATVNQDYIYLRGVYGVAEHLFGVPVSLEPFIKAKPVLDKFSLIGKSEDRVRRPEVDEITAIVELAYKSRKGPYHQNKDYAPLDKIIVFAMFSSRRLSEIGRINWADLDKQKQTIVVRDMKDPNKNKRSRANDIECYLPEEAMAVIESMPVIDGEPRIFPFNHRSFGTNFQRMRAKAGFEYPNDQDQNLRFHDLRHEAISWLFEKNGYKGEVWDIPKVAKVSGHKSWSSLQIYEDIISPVPRDRWENWEWKTKVLD